jgi:hypothetical protein
MSKINHLRIDRALLLGFALGFAGSLLATAQDSSTEAPSMPKVLQIQREFIKPGKGGALHDRSEAAFVQAMERAKWPTYYIAMNSVTGKSRALYFTAYDSFEAYEKDTAAAAKNATLSADLERAALNDGELLDSTDASLWTFNPEESYRPQPDISSKRYDEITLFHVRPGHGQDWKTLVQMVIDGHRKAGTSAHWATYEIAFGAEDGNYLVITADHSLSEVDRGFAEDKQFQDAMGPDGLKKLDELYGATVDHAESQLFAVNPRQSYVPGDWIKAYPDFWKPGTMLASAPVKARAAKPAAKTVAQAKQPNP